MKFEEAKRGALTPRVVTRITGIWLIGYCCMYYLGSFIAGVLRDCLSYSGQLVFYDMERLLAIQAFEVKSMATESRCLHPHKNPQSNNKSVLCRSKLKSTIFRDSRDPISYMPCSSSYLHYNEIHVFDRG